MSLQHCRAWLIVPVARKSLKASNTAAGSISLSLSAGMMHWQSHSGVLVTTCGAEDVGQLSMQVPLLNGVHSQHQAPLADLAEWLSQNLQEDLQGDAMVSSPTHPSRWGPLAPAGIVESKIFMQPCAVCTCGMLATYPLLRHDSWLAEIGRPRDVFQITFGIHSGTSTASSNYSCNVHHMHCDTCSITGSQVPHTF